MTVAFSHIPRTSLDTDAVGLYDRILETRGAVAESIGLIGADGSMRGPFGPLLLTPKLGDVLQQLGISAKADTTLSPAVFEVVALTVSRIRDCAFEWSAHRSLAIASGVLREAEVDRIAEDLPPGASDDTAIAWSFARQQAAIGMIDESTMVAAIECFGDRGAVELTVVTGYYVLISMLVRTCSPRELSGRNREEDP